MLFSFFSSDSDDDVRIVRTPKDRFVMNINTSARKISSAIKTNNWIVVQTEFQTMNRDITKFAKVVEEIGLPTPYFRSLVFIEDAVNEFLEQKKNSKAKGKTLDKPNKKAFSQMKLVIRKHNADYETEIEECRRNLTRDDDEWSDSDDSDSSDSDSSGSDSSGSDSSDSDSSDSDSSDSDSEDESGDESGDDSDSDSSDSDSDDDDDSGSDSDNEEGDEEAKEVAYPHVFSHLFVR